MQVLTWCESPDELLIQHQESSVDERFEASRHEVARLSCDDDSDAPYCNQVYQARLCKVDSHTVVSLLQRYSHKVIDPTELSALNIEIAETLCLLEMVFPLSLFDMMVHLLGHIVDTGDGVPVILVRYDGTPLGSHRGRDKDTKTGILTSDVSV